MNKKIINQLKKAKSSQEVEGILSSNNLAYDMLIDQEPLIFLYTRTDNVEIFNWLAEQYLTSNMPISQLKSFNELNIFQIAIKNEHIYKELTTNVKYSADVKQMLAQPISRYYYNSEQKEVKYSLAADLIASYDNLNNMEAFRRLLLNHPETVNISESLKTASRNPTLFHLLVSKCPKEILDIILSNPRFEQQLIDMFSNQELLLEDSNETPFRYAILNPNPQIFLDFYNYIEKKISEDDILAMFIQPNSHMETLIANLARKHHPSMTYVINDLVSKNTINNNMDFIHHLEAAGAYAVSNKHYDYIESLLKSLENDINNNAFLSNTDIKKILSKELNNVNLLFNMLSLWSGKNPIENKLVNKFLDLILTDSQTAKQLRDEIFNHYGFQKINSDDYDFQRSPIFYAIKNYDHSILNKLDKLFTDYKQNINWEQAFFTAGTSHSPFSELSSASDFESKYNWLTSKQPFPLLDSFLTDANKGANWVNARRLEFGFDDETQKSPNPPKENNIFKQTPPSFFIAKKSKLKEIQYFLNKNPKISDIELLLMADMAYEQNPNPAVLEEILKHLNNNNVEQVVANFINKNNFTDNSLVFWLNPEEKSEFRSQLLSNGGSNFSRSQEMLTIDFKNLFWIADENLGKVPKLEEKNKILASHITNIKPKDNLNIAEKRTTSTISSIQGIITKLALKDVITKDDSFSKSKAFDRIKELVIKSIVKNKKITNFKNIKITDFNDKTSYFSKFTFEAQATLIEQKISQKALSKKEFGEFVFAAFLGNSLKPNSKKSDINAHSANESLEAINRMFNEKPLIIDFLKNEISSMSDIERKIFSNLIYKSLFRLANKAISGGAEFNNSEINYLTDSIYEHLKTLIGVYTPPKDELIVQRESINDIVELFATANNEKTTINNPTLAVYIESVLPFVTGGQNNQIHINNIINLSPNNNILTDLKEQGNRISVKILGKMADLTINRGLLSNWSRKQYNPQTSKNSAFATVISSLQNTQFKKSSDFKSFYNSIILGSKIDFQLGTSDTYYKSFNNVRQKMVEDFGTTATATSFKMYFQDLTGINKESINILKSLINTLEPEEASGAFHAFSNFLAYSNDRYDELFLSDTSMELEFRKCWDLLVDKLDTETASGILIVAMANLISANQTFGSRMLLNYMLNNEKLVSPLYSYKNKTIAELNIEQHFSKLKQSLLRNIKKGIEQSHLIDLVIGLVVTSTNPYSWIRNKTSTEVTKITSDIIKNIDLEKIMPDNQTDQMLKHIATLANDTDDASIENSLVVLMNEIEKISINNQTKATVANANIFKKRI